MSIIKHAADAFQAAPFAAAGWDAALRALANATGSSRGQLLAIGHRHMKFNWVTDTPEGYLDHFLSIGADRPEVNWRIAASSGVFELVHEAHYDTVRAGGTNEAYLDHAKRFDAEFGCQTTLLNETGAFFGMACLRNDRDGRTTEADRAAFLALAPHAFTAIRTQNALEHQGGELLRGSLEAMRVAAVLLDSAGDVRAMTPAAEAAIASGMIELRDRRLRARMSVHDRMLQQRIASALRNATGGSQSDLWLGVDGEMRALVEAFALPRNDCGFGFAPAVVVTIRAPAVIGSGEATAIAAALGLTPAEGEVMAMLAAGAARTTIAAARGTTAHTVASQLKTIFRKCDVRREAELIALVGSIVGKT